MTTFEKDSWLWVTDPTDCFLPAKVNGSFNQGSAGSVTFENGTTKELSAAESKECQQMDEQSLDVLENMVHFNDLKDAVLVSRTVHTDVQNLNSCSGSCDCFASCITSASDSKMTKSTPGICLPSIDSTRR
jgi:hypothetical protein